MSSETPSRLKGIETPLGGSVAGKLSFGNTFPFEGN